MPRGGWETLLSALCSLGQVPWAVLHAGAGFKEQDAWHSGCSRLQGLTFIHACREVISKLFFIQLLSAIYNTVYKQVSDLVSNLYLKINIIDSEF